MDRFANFIVNHKKSIIVFFLMIVAACAVLQSYVRVNYSMVDYLPPEAKSTKAIEIMDAEFTQAVPNTRVMVKNVSITEALEYKKAIEQIDGVAEVLWLDDVIDVKKPLGIAQQETVESFYKDGNALFSVAIVKGKEMTVVKELQNLIGEDNSVAGEAPNLVSVQETAGGEVFSAVLILVPFIIFILIISTSSWLEPVLFLAAIGSSVLINMGTNIFLVEISYITKAVTPILQLACSLDYAIFLLHSFAQHRSECDDVEQAMKMAIKESISTIAASAATTLFGFLALVFMRFGIGGDLGLNLAKGIIFSFLSVVVFLPALTLSIYKFIDKTQHRVIMPGFKSVYKYLSKIALLSVAVIAIVVVPSYLGQGQTRFTYGLDTEADATNRIGRDTIAIKDEFGQSILLAMVVPRGDVAKEKELSESLDKLDHVTSVVSYASSVGAVIPSDFLDDSITSQFYSENYARIIIYTDTSMEGTVAFATVEAVESIAATYYGDEVYVAGQSANIYDMRTTLRQDFTFVNLIAIVAIFAVLLITFKSATLPFILLLTIEAGIWINLAIPYFTGTTIGFIGYLIISSVELGATVDYAILFTNNYLRSRRLLPKKAALSKAMGQSFLPILISGSILAVAGFTLSGISTNAIVHELGLLVGRGAILSVCMVTLFLPGLLRIFDKLISISTYKADFFSSNKNNIITNLEADHEA